MTTLISKPSSNQRPATSREASAAQRLRANEVAGKTRTPGDTTQHGVGGFAEADGSFDCHRPSTIRKSLCAALSSTLRAGLHSSLPYAAIAFSTVVSAAYLWLDIENRKALYSAAGHPPLLRWREGKLERIESNGLLFGVNPEADYPVCDLSIHSGDRFLLYTDGVTEPQNASGDSFGDRRLERVVRDNQSRLPSELSEQLLSEIRVWQSASVAQQDDITLIVIDVL